MASNSTQLCYLPSEDGQWGDCCESLGLLPKPLWFYVAISLPVEWLLVSMKQKDDGTTAKRKTQQELVFFVGLTAVSLVLISTKLAFPNDNTQSCYDFWTCYQGLVFMFSNSAALVTCLTLWIRIEVKKHFPALLRFAYTAVPASRPIFDEYTPNGLWDPELERMAKADTKYGREHYFSALVVLIGGGLTHVLISIGIFFPAVLLIVLALVVAQVVRVKSQDEATRGIWTTAYFPLCILALAVLVPAHWLVLVPLRVVARGFNRCWKYVRPIDTSLQKELEREDLCREIQAREKELEEMREKFSPVEFDKFLKQNLATSGFIGDEVRPGAITRAEEPSEADMDERLAEFPSKSLTIPKPTLKPDAAPKGAPKKKKKERSRRRKSSDASEDEEEGDYEDVADEVVQISTGGFFPAPPPPSSSAPVKSAEEERSLEELLSERDPWLMRSAKLQVPIDEEALHAEFGAGVLRESGLVGLDDLEGQKVEQPVAPRARKKGGGLTLRISAKKVREKILKELKNLVLFDAYGHVILWGGSVVFILFTLAANYSLLIYSRIPFWKAPAMDWKARDTVAMFECYADQFTDFSVSTALGVVELSVFIVPAAFSFLAFIKSVQK